MNQDTRLWIVLLVPAVLWAAHLQTVYSLHPTACEAGNDVVLWLASLLLLAAQAVLILHAYRLWRVHPASMTEHVDEDPSTNWARVRFMALMGLLGSCFFALMVIAQTVPFLLLRPCD